MMGIYNASLRIMIMGAMLQMVTSDTSDWMQQATISMIRGGCIRVLVLARMMVIFIQEVIDTLIAWIPTLYQRSFIMVLPGFQMVPHTGQRN